MEGARLCGGPASTTKGQRMFPVFPSLDKALLKGEVEYIKKWDLSKTRGNSFQLYMGLYLDQQTS